MTSIHPTPPVGPDAAADVPASAGDLLAQLLASQEQARNSQSQHDLGRKQLPTLILQLAQLAGQQQSIEQESRQRLAEARNVIKTIASSATLLNDSMSREYQALLALVNSPEALAQLSSSASRLTTAPPSTQPPAAPQPAIAPPPPIVSAPARAPVPALHQLRERLLQMIRQEAERRVAERGALSAQHSARIRGGRRR